MSRQLLRIGIAFLASVLSACAIVTTTQIYDGPKRPDSEISIVRGDNNLLIRKIDGKEGHYTAEVFRGPFVSKGLELQFLPGYHIIEVYWAGELLASQKPLVLSFSAEAGKIYLINYKLDRKERRWSAWIDKDVNTAPNAATK